jgi:hypothetical protein
MVYKYTKNSEGEYKCHICGETREKQNTMHYHLKSHEDHLAHKCNHCKMEFKAKYSLDVHINTQHNRLEENLFRCPIQNCRFKGSPTKSNLLIHYVRIHCKNEVENIRCGLTCKVCNKESNSLTAFHYHAISCITIQDTTRQEEFQSLI